MTDSKVFISDDEIRAALRRDAEQHSFNERKPAVMVDSGATEHVHPTNEKTEQLIAERDARNAKTTDVSGHSKWEDVKVKLEAVKAKPKSVLAEADELINGPRQHAYGHPRVNMARIAALWNAYLDYRSGWEDEECHNLTESEVAQMMALLKIARLQGPGDPRDSVVDACGYMGIVELLEKE